MLNGKPASLTGRVSMIKYFFLLGFFSLLSQIVLLRELVSWLGGDELFYALGLGFWLILAGLGSLIFNKHRPRSRFATPRRCLVAVYPFLTPILIIVIRYGLGHLLPPGQIPGLGLSLVIIFLATFIPAILSGVLFYLGSKKWSNSTRAYLWETVGFFSAGLMFTFLFSQTSFPLPKKIDNQTMRWRYPNLEKAIYSKGSQLVVTREADQKTIFSSGQIAFNSQQANFTSLAGRIFSHLDLPQPDSGVLVFGDLHLANEMTWWSNDNSVIYLQPEKKLGLEQMEYLKSEVDLADNELRLYLESESELSWIILSPGGPQTLSASRYYTLETLNLVKRSLTSRGIGVLIFDLPIDYQSEEAIRYGQVIYNTFDQVFEKVDLLIIEGKVVLIGSNAEISYDSRDSSGLVEMVLTDSRRDQLKEKLSAGARVNTARQPLAYFHHHLFWQTMFSFQLPKLFRHLILLVPISLGVMLIDLFQRLDNQRKLGVVMAISGFILMSLETVLLFLFQAQFGHIYAYLGLIMGTVLLGLAIGTATAVKFPSRPERAVLAYLPIGAFFLLDFWQNLFLIWLILALLVGLVGGLIFGLTNNLWIEKNDQPTFIYASDLFGSFLGVVLTSTILLPRFGLVVLLLVLFGLALIPRLEL